MVNLKFEQLVLFHYFYTLHGLSSFKNAYSLKCIDCTQFFVSLYLFFAIGKKLDELHYKFVSDIVMFSQIMIEHVVYFFSYES